MKKLNLPKYRGDQFSAASNVFFDVLANRNDVIGQNVIAGRPEPLNREQLDGHLADDFQQTFADRNAQSEEQTN